MTAKALITDMIEGKSPIAMLIEQLSRPDRETAIKLLYRIQKLFQARVDAIKILNLYFKLDSSKSQKEKTLLLTKLKGLVGQFTTENKIYGSHFIYKG